MSHLLLGPPLKQKQQHLKPQPQLGGNPKQTKEKAQGGDPFPDDEASTEESPAAKDSLKDLTGAMTKVDPIKFPPLPEAPYHRQWKKKSIRLVAAAWHRPIVAQNWFVQTFKASS